MFNLLNQTLNKEKKNIAISGSGFAGLASAAILASKGYNVDLYEKNSSLGGRARKFESDGFMFDMGPSWYWMPEVFEGFFQLFGKKSSDFYELLRLDPSYRVFWPDQEYWDIPASMEELVQLFESQEKGAGPKLLAFLNEAERKYRAGMQKFVWKPSLSPLEFVRLEILKESFRLDLFKSVSAHIRKYFSNPRLIELLEFPVLFLGARPADTPALYTLMNFADMKLGTFYPMGGMHKIVEAFEQIAREQGVNFHLNSEIQAVRIEGKTLTTVTVNQEEIPFDGMVCASDYQHFDQNILPANHRSYTGEYWEKRIMAPSCLLFYLGVDKKIPELRHHNLFFDRDFNQHAEEIYTTHKWPEEPLFYVCCPSVTDPGVAPIGHENLFILIPVSTNISDTPEHHEIYFEKVMDRLEKRTGTEIRNHIVFKRSYAHSDFIQDYHAYRGNAYGLANTLRQTAFLKPKMHHKGIKNLVFSGQLTVPGPGMPPSIISGQLAATLINNYLN